MDSALPRHFMDDRIRVELFCMQYDCTEILELVAAVSNSVRWKDRLDVRISHIAGNPRAATPYGVVGEHTVVVCGTHVVRGPDYQGLVRALEDCAGIRVGVLEA